MVNEYGYLLHYIMGVGYERRDQRINDYIRQNRNRIGLVGDYRLGVLDGNGTFQEGEFDDFREEDREDGTPGRVWRTQAVYGRVRNEEGVVGDLTHLFEPSREVDRGLNPENYDINSSHLRDILDEVAKIYYSYYKNHLDEAPEGVDTYYIESTDPNTFERPNNFNFLRGDGYEFVDGCNRTIPAFPTDHNGRGESDH